MALSPQKAAIMDQIAGTHTDVNAQPPDPTTQSRASYLTSLVNSIPPAPAQTAPPATASFGSRVQADVANRGTDVMSAMSDFGKKSDVAVGAKMGGDIVGLPVDVAGEVLKSIPGADQIGQAIKSFFTAGVNPVDTKQLTATLAPHIQTLAAQHPGAVDILKAIGEAANFAGLATGGKDLAEAATGMIKKGVGAAGDVATSIKSGASNLTEGVVSKVKGIGTLKPTPEILATPEISVRNLKPEEQKIWLDNQAEQIAAKEQLGKENISATEKAFQEKSAKTAEAKASQAEQRANDLLKQQEISAQNKTMELKPKSLKFFGEQSQEYRKIVADEWKGKETTPIKTDDLKAHIDQRFSEDPGRAEAIKARLGLTEKVNPLSTKTFGESVPTKLKTDMTLGDIKNQITDLRQTGIGSAAKSGARVYTADEKLTDDAISTLNDYLKNNGVDFKNANQFWSRYAPLRDRMITEIKPFDIGGIKKTTFGDTLTEVIKNPDSQNKRFISAVEDGLGESVTSEGKNILAKLNETQKAAVVAKYNAAMEKEAAKISSESGRTRLSKDISEQTKALEAKKQELARSNFTKKFWKVAIPAIIGGDMTLKRMTGLGL